MCIIWISSYEVGITSVYKLGKYRSEKLSVYYLGGNESKNLARHSWLTPVILATWEVRPGRLQFEASK
jgi:hypothetical protein